MQNVLTNALIFLFLFHSGKIDLGYIDPVMIGRGVFNATNEFMCGVASYIQDVLCSILDTTLNVVKGICALSFNP